MKRKRMGIMRAIRNLVCLFLILLVFIAYKMEKTKYELIKSQFYMPATKYIEFEEKVYKNTHKIGTLRRLIEQYNRKEDILNLDVHGSLGSNAAVFIIFVGKYKANLKYLVASLQNVTGISDSLIIFSHSYFDENVNSLIKTIDFTRVVQIFYPFSLQLYPKELLDHPTGGCVYGMKNDTALKSNCYEGKTGEHEGYSDPALSHDKHFWWWTMNHVFRKLSHTKKHNGIFTFLDDDVFLLQDVIYMTSQMNEICKLISRCDFISVHTSGLPNYYETKSYGAEIKTWNPKQHSSVLAFNSRVWQIIANHFYFFCNFEDYSWARSLLHLSLNRIDGQRFTVISSTMPRAFTTNAPHATPGPFLEFGIINAVHKILDLQKRNRGGLYPHQMEIFVDINVNFNDSFSLNHVDRRGHWGASRDISLCFKIAGRRRIKKVKRVFK